MIRLVKLTFLPEKVEEFLLLFEERKEIIRRFPGCRHLELWRSKKEPNVFFTYSLWERETDLEEYRQSDFFKTTWKKTKSLFSRPPEAWSVDKL